MSTLVRRLDADALAHARPLLAPEGWTFETGELDRLRRLGGAVGAYDGAALVGFLSFVDTPPVRWIGNVAVAPAMRGGGIGEALVQEAVRDAPRAALYSVEKATSLYARLGFEPRGRLRALRAEAARPLAAAPTERLELTDLAEAAALDRALTGMDRAGLLRALLDAYPEHARLVRRDGRVAGYGFAKAYDDVTEVGPIVALRDEDAAALLDALLDASPAPHELAVHEENTAALAAARARGFEARFVATAMFRGAPPAWDLARYHFAAGLEKG